MKAYTDLEQSRKLAEFLPIESADMWWAERYAGRVENYEYIVEEKPVYYLSFTRPSEENYSQDTIKDIPCWSLAALLDVFSNSEQKSVDVCHGGWKGEEYVSNWFCSYDDYEKNYFETTNSGNPIDACYKMIIKLHEKNLL